MTTEKVISRVKKLMALAGGTHSTEEAQSAMVMAQRLLAEHGMTEKDLAEKGAEIEVVHGRIYSTKKRDTATGSLAATIAKNFRCLAYWNSAAVSFNRNGRRQSEFTLFFVGLAEDVEIAAETFRTARGAMNRLADEFLANHKPRLYVHPKTARTSYLMGWAAGLYAKFEAAKQNDQTMALALTTPNAVQQEYDGMNLRKGVSPKFRNFDQQASAAGYADGSQFGSAIRSSNPA